MGEVEHALFRDRVRLCGRVPERGGAARLSQGHHASDGRSADEARNRLVESLKDEARTNAAAYINEIMDEAKLNANQQAKKIVIQTIQRVATETAVENSVSVFHIENDEVKGRIIGREGRNIALLKLPVALKS